ncbi:stress response protein NST1-like [Chenopodium quinoa]|uniref:stress response protein NST1-like n=1 Tax=Chenopodium quinoa TaxID=63459 RepID=UPI000B783590|nr:stress response protein NST1-like [Chenopodium quinoa]
MVAISLYRGNLHRLPSDVPRRWLMPTHGISIKDFRSLLCRRSKALSLLPSSSSSVVENPNPNFNLNPVNSLPPPPNQSGFKGVENPNLGHEPSSDVVTVDVRMSDAGDSAPLDHPPLVIDEGVKMLVEIKEKENEKKKEKESAPVVDNPIPTTLEGDDKVDEKEKRKREVEEKLHILNEKKHNLVQALKQILNAEEELKRRSSMQASRPPLPLQVDVSNDSGSMTRHATPRTGSEANLNVDMEGGEGDDAVNNNPQSRQLLRMSSTSPSAESALRRAPYFQHNAAPHPSRAALVAAGSPSRFAPSGNQGHPSNLPTVSVSGTNYFASSPSPAASGGTSGFRDARHPSPWN